eukprot:COSAG04_NODE_16655_length_492_cov_1.872774_2_plen_80_part_01
MISVVFALLLAAACSALPHPTPAPTPPPAAHAAPLDPKENPLLVAHRGDSIAAPENTLEAFASAHEKGADVLETDVFLSS